MSSVFVYFFVSTVQIFPMKLSPLTWWQYPHDNSELFQDTHKTGRQKD